MGKETVFVVTKRNGNNGAGTYHTNRGCRYLRRAKGVRSVRRSALDTEREPCAVCAGEAEPTGGADTLYHRARNADPDAIKQT